MLNSAGATHPLPGETLDERGKTLNILAASGGDWDDEQLPNTNLRARSRHGLADWVGRVSCRPLPVPHAQAGQGATAGDLKKTPPVFQGREGRTVVAVPLRSSFAFRTIDDHQEANRFLQTLSSFALPFINCCSGFEEQRGHGQCTKSRGSVGQGCAVTLRHRFRRSLPLI